MNFEVQKSGSGKALRAARQQAVNPLTGQPLQPVAPGALEALTPLQRTEMTIVQVANEPGYVPFNKRKARHFSDDAMGNAIAHFDKLNPSLKATEKERKQAAELVAKWDAAQELREKLNLNICLAEAKSQRDKLAAMVESGDPESHKKLLQFDLYSRSELMKENSAKRSIVGDHMRSLVALAAPIARPAALRYSEFAPKIAAELESQERAFAEKFHVPFQPSNVLLLFREFQWSIMNFADEPWINPRNLFTPLGLL